VLLARLTARPDLQADDAAAGQITRLCGYLPLAIGMAGRQLYHHPAWTAASLAADLAAARDRLAVMHAENLSVAAAFDLSYRDLPGDQQRLFRRLGLHGPRYRRLCRGCADDISLTRRAAAAGGPMVSTAHRGRPRPLPAATCSASTPAPSP
jgi:hypothetical protein